MRMLSRATLVALMVGSIACGSVDNTADLVLINGRVYTVDDNQPWAEAIAVRDDIIIAVGGNAEIQRLAGPTTQTIDLEGAFATAGFIDGHVHVGGTGALLLGVNLLDVHEPIAFTERIRAAAERMPSGSLISGGSWGAYEQWASGSAGESTTEAVSEPFTPHRNLIDEFTPDHPVLLSRFDRSMHLANTRALDLAGINESTLNPTNGEFVRDERGHLTGILKGEAYAQVRRSMPDKSFEVRMAEFAAVQSEARSGGITTIQDLTSPEMLRVYCSL